MVSCFSQGKCKQVRPGLELEYANLISYGNNRVAKRAFQTHVDIDPWSNNFYLTLDIFNKFSSFWSSHIK